MPTNGILTIPPHNKAKKGEFIMYAPQPNQDGVRNVNMLERWLSMIGGGALTTMGLRRSGLRGFLMTLVGGYLAQRGLSGHCSIYRALGINTLGQSQRDSYSFYDPTSRGEHSFDVQANQPTTGQSRRRSATTVGPTPGSAEGDRETVEADLRSKSPTTGL
jgi:hypothetical protein